MIATIPGAVGLTTLAVGLAVTVTIAHLIEQSAQDAELLVGFGASVQAGRPSN